MVLCLSLMGRINFAFVLLFQLISTVFFLHFWGYLLHSFYILKLYQLVVTSGKVMTEIFDYLKAKTGVCIGKSLS